MQLVMRCVGRLAVDGGEPGPKLAGESRDLFGLRSSVACIMPETKPQHQPKPAS